MATPSYNEAIFQKLPPADVQYQLAHVHESRAKEVVVSQLVCLAIAVVAVALRFLSRCISKTPLKSDDWMIVAAMVWMGRFLVVLIAADGLLSVLCSLLRYFSTALHHKLWWRPSCYPT